MGNSILPVTNEYSEHNLNFNEESYEESYEEPNNNNQDEKEDKYDNLENRVEQIEKTTLSNLKLISEDVHHLFELYNKLKSVINTEPPVVV
jgi:hypothetical protein